MSRLLRRILGERVTLAIFGVGCGVFVSLQPINPQENDCFFSYGYQNGPYADSYIDRESTYCSSHIENTVCEVDQCNPSRQCKPTGTGIYAYCIDIDYYGDYPACYDCRIA